MPAAQFGVALAQNLASNYNMQESQMNSVLTSIVLCLMAQTAAAQCVTTVATSPHCVTTVSAPPLAKPRQGGELIKSAAAGTHDAPAIRQASATAAATPGAGGEDQPGRTGPAMVLVAVAVMTAIAVRRGTSSR